MVSPNLRVLILQSEHERICDYVTRVPHRSTGGLLRGMRFTQGGQEYIAVTLTAATVPDELLDDETCADHPQHTVAEVLQSPEKVGSQHLFLGRWHAHTDGLNRPSAADLEWALPFLREPDLHRTEILHPIVTVAGGEVRIHPYVVTRDSLTFHKVNWQITTVTELDQIRSGANRAAAPTKAVDSQIFSLAKVRELLREERQVVAEMEDVVRCEVLERGSHAILEVEIFAAGSRALVQISASSLYPVHAPRVALNIDEHPAAYVPPSVQDWSSAYKMTTVVAEITAHLRGEDLPPAEAPPAPVAREADKVATSPAAFFLYFLLMISLGMGIYLWYTGIGADLGRMFERMGAEQPTPQASPSRVVAPPRENLPLAPPPMQVAEQLPLLAVVVNCGDGVNVSPRDAAWAIETALRPLKVRSVAVSLKSPTNDLASVRARAQGAGGVLYIPHEAGPRQASFLTSLRSLGLPIGVLSTATGKEEASLSQGVAFYRAVARPGRREALQRTLLEARRSRVLVVGTPPPAPPATAAPTANAAPPALAPSASPMAAPSSAPVTEPTSNHGSM